LAQGIQEKVGISMTGSHLHPADLAIIIGYFVLMISMGVYFRKFMTQVKDYFTGSNQVPWWLAGVSYYMSSFSAMTFVMYAEIAYLYGWVAVTLWWVGIPACLVAAWWIGPRWRRARILSPVEFLEHRFSHSMRQLFAWTGFPMRLAEDGVRLYAIGVFISFGFGLPLRWAIVACTVVIVLYSYLGGLWAVVVNDFVQFSVLFLTLLILLPMAWWRVGGWGGFIQHVPNPHRYLALTNPPYGWLYVAAAGMITLLTYNASWALVQRFYCVRDEADARKVGYLVALLNFIGPPLFFLPLLLARPWLAHLQAARYSYAAMAMNLLPLGMGGLFLTAMLASAMSCLSGDFNVLASVATADIYQRLFNRSAQQRQLLKVGKILTATIGAAVLAVALWVTFYPHTPLFSIMMGYSGIGVAPMMMPLLGGLLFPGLTYRGALAGFFASLLSGLLMLFLQLYYLPKVPGLSHTWITFNFQAYSIFVNIAVCAVTMVVYSLLDKRRPADESTVADFFAKMALPIEATGEFQPSAKMPSPFYIVGLVIMGMGVILTGVGVAQPTRLGLTIVTTAALVFLLFGGFLYRAGRKSSQPTAAVLSPTSKRS
jgi:SSS family solute:Na+ symporter